ncbi:MAG: hypothetical protein H6613_08715 [Ignavibacteriales bacterium]|nr:hypothetical protein [Ignavibacteriales bacterium]
MIEVDIKKKIKKYLQNIEDDLIKSNTSLSAFNLLNEFEIIKHSPGIEEYGLLMAYEEITINQSDFDFIIFDMPPTALTLKIFSLPTISALWLNKLIDLRERIKKKKEIVSRMKIGNTEIEKDKILDKLYKQKNKYQIIEEVFKDKSRTKINLVVNPEKLSINEGLNIIKEFENYKISINNILVNKSVIRQKQLQEFKDFTQINFPTTKSKLIGISSLEKFINEMDDL